MFEYVFTPESKSGKINTEGFCNDMSEIKQELISQTDSCVHHRSTYPNGFILESEQYADKIIVRTNWELIPDENGNFNPLQA